ncbi:MAG: methyltransferase [Pseudomonadota bacterium]
MTIRTFLAASASALLLAACGGSGGDEKLVEETSTETTETAEDTTTTVASSDILSAALEGQPDDAKARYPYRNPKETIEFFGIEPGMTVVEVLPGGGWYSKILIPYLGDEGTLIGADYSVDMWGNFGGFATEEFLEGKKTWPETWVTNATEWLGENTTDLKAFAFGSRDESLDGTVDVVVMVRAIHHLNRFNTDEKNYMTEALGDINALLKPGGVLGIVGHRAPEANDDDWANGDNGYNKQSAVIGWAEAAGFELVESSEINANPLDKPTEDDFVWRLPPTLGTSGDNPELRAEMQAIGETDRMTLKFRKK